MSKQSTRRAIAGLVVGAAVAAAACSSDARDGSSTSAATSVAGSSTSRGTTSPAAATTTAATAPLATVAPATMAADAAVGSTTTQPPMVIDVSVQPGSGTDGYVGARPDVSGETCAADGADFASAGTVTNSTGATASYRIYSTLVRPNGTTAAVIEADVTSLPAGGSAGFSSVLPAAAGPFECVLRVERIAG